MVVRSAARSDQTGLPTELNRFRFRKVHRERRVRCRFRAMTQLKLWCTLFYRETREIGHEQNRHVE